MKQKQHKIVYYTLIGLGIAIYLVVSFLLHRMTPFMRDDLWYSTNLVTEQPTSSLADILQSQVWHYFNWGGRVINHGVLQAVLATGEVWADILNVAVTALLGLVICLFADRRDPLFFLLAESLIVALNPSIFFSMYWESGSANYLYSSVWIFCYLFLVSRELSDKPKLRGIEFWILPLALITGWSNENMGPASFVLTVCTMIYLKHKHKKIPLWIWEGAAMTLLGSGLVILAPGNFVRNQFAEHLPLKETLMVRYSTMMEITFRSFLYPAFLLALAVMAVEIGAFRQKLSGTQVFLFAFAVVAHLGLALSPTYPQRASFGSMIALIAFMVHTLSGIYHESEEYRKPIMVLTASCFACAIYVLIRDMILPAF